MNRVDYAGNFIIIEGIDGSGKDTQADLLTKRLRCLGRDVMHISSPSKRFREQPEVKQFTKTGQSRLSLETMALLGAADRMRECDTTIKPALEKGEDVVCVRYTYSALGYYARRGADVDFVAAINRLALPPSHGVLLSLSPDEALERVNRRRGDNDFEEKDPAYLNDIQIEMLRRWPSNFLVVDAALSPTEISDEVFSYVTGDRSLS